MTEFAYNNAKNTSTGYTSFELNYGFHLWVLFKEEIDPYSRFRLANKLADELRELMKICCQNLLYAQKLQKRIYNEGVKSCSYTPSEKVWLNNKYIKTK